MNSLRDLAAKFISLDERSSQTAPDKLTALAVVYLALPALIFIGGWLRPAFALGLLALCIVALSRYIASTWGRPIHHTPWAVLLIALFAFSWSIFGGAGHFFYANPDWHVRDTILGDLTLSAWPPAYSIHDGTFHILRSAIGYFLPAAALGKVLGKPWLDSLLYLWTALGTTLFLLLLPLPRRACWALFGLLLVTAFFSGMDFLGGVLVTGDLPIFPLRLEWWVPFSYTSLTGQLYWAPNHALPLWLTTALFYRHWGHPQFGRLTVVLMPLLVIWTPFAVIAPLPFLALAAARWWQRGGRLNTIGATALEWLAGIALSYVCIRVMTLDVAAIPGAPTAQVTSRPDSFVLDYLIFALMEFAILALLLSRELKHSHGLLWLSFAILALLPFYQFGPSNDSLLRLSTPPLVILLCLLLSQLQQWNDLELRRLPGTAWIIFVVILIGACTPFNEIYRAATFRRMPTNYGMSLVEEQHNNEPPHYVGKLNRVDVSALLKRPSLVPTTEERAQLVVPAGSNPK